jgi:hypothetical protein
VPFFEVAAAGIRTCALGHSLAVFIEDERDMSPFRSVKPEGVVEEGVASGGGEEEVVAADDLGDALCGVVDHHGQVVRRDAVTPHEDEVVDRSRGVAVTEVPEGHYGAAGTDAPRVGLARICTISCIKGGEPTARSGVDLLAGLLMRCLDGGCDVTAGAEAPVSQITGREPPKGRFIDGVALGLAKRLVVPVEAQSAQISEL